MNLIQSYALFQDKTFWTTHGAPTSALLATLVGTVKPEGSSQIIRTADLLVQTIPPDQLSSLSGIFIFSILYFQIWYSVFPEASPRVFSLPSR